MNNPLFRENLMLVLVLISINILSGCGMLPQTFRFGDKVFLRNGVFLSGIEGVVKEQWADEFVGDCRFGKYLVVFQKNGVQTERLLCGEEIYQ